MQTGQLGDRTRYWPTKSVTLQTQRIELSHISYIPWNRAGKSVVFNVDVLEFGQAEKQKRKRTSDVSEVRQVNSIQILHLHQGRRDCTGQVAVRFFVITPEGETRDPGAGEAGDAGPLAAVGARLPVQKHAGGVMGDGRFEGKETGLVVDVAGGGGGGEDAEGEEEEEGETGSESYHGSGGGLSGSGKWGTLSHCLGI